MRLEPFSHLPVSGAALGYAQYLLKHPAMREWYEAALIERWREVSHEEEIAAAGAILADYRQGP